MANLFAVVVGVATFWTLSWEVGWAWAMAASLAAMALAQVAWGFFARLLADLMQ